MSTHFRAHHTHARVRAHIPFLHVLCNGHSLDLAFYHDMCNVYCCIAQKKNFPNYAMYEMHPNLTPTTSTTITTTATIITITPSLLQQNA